MPVPERHFVSGRSLVGPFPEGLEKAVFGLGCFWGAERVFWQAPGVWMTAVGYAGGTTPNPTYNPLTVNYDTDIGLVIAQSPAVNNSTVSSGSLRMI